MNFGISNKFAVLQPVQPRPKGEKLIKSIPGPVSNVPKNLQEPSQTTSEPVTKTNNNNNNNRRGGERGGRGGSRGGSRGGRGGRVDRATLEKLRDPEQPPKRNKRIYDRNSNVPKNDAKKGGAGTGNWGNEKEDPQRGAEDATKEITTETKADENIVVEEVEEKTITLKEYQEQRAALAPKIEAPKRREANEGEKNDLKNYVVLKKDEEDDKLFAKPKKEKAKKKKQQQTIPQPELLNVNSGSEERRPRKNFNNNNYKKQKKVNLPIEDTDSFPALK